MCSAVNNGRPGLSTALPVPNWPPPPAPSQFSASNVVAILQAILANTERQDKQLTKVCCKEQGELKEIATATQVKDDMESLVARVTALEQQ